MAPANDGMSVGEYDSRSGLTHITQQRGRLMFHMGAQSTKRSAPREHESAMPRDYEVVENDSTPVAQPLKRPRHTLRIFRSGVFTGRSLYAEEVVHLMQRQAIVVYEMEELDPTKGSDNCPNSTPAIDRAPMTFAALTRAVVRDGHASVASLDAYCFLKDSKLHPRRMVLDSGGRPPSPPLFDVFTSITETVYTPIHHDTPIHAEDSKDCSRIDTTDSTSAPRLKKQKRKRMVLVARVVVLGYRDDCPSPAELRRLIEHTNLQETSEPPAVPIKLAVVDADRSVLLFEVC